MVLLRGLWELFASTLAPNRCAACDADVPVMTAFCRTCAATLTLPEAHAGSAHRAAFAYGGAVARAITRLKFEGRPDLARPLAAALRRVASLMKGDGLDVVVPVPLHPRRLVERGYNQSALLARPVARDLDARFLPRALLRTRETDPQAKLDRGQRLSNLEGAFAVHRARDVERRRVLVVDDVRTTGATLRACARALREAGALEVRTLVVAQTETVGDDRGG
jgi:ComF family protein